MNNILTFAMLQAVAAANPEGFTVNANNFEPITTGYAVAVKETQNSFGKDGAARVIQFQSENTEKVNAFGGWRDSETGLYYYDATIIVNSLEEATRLGRANGQIAVFHLDTMQEIRL